MFRIAKEFHFSSAHVLKGLGADHPCARLHGHNYVVVLTCESRLLNDVGMVYDYRGMSKFKKWIDEEVDHRNLNDLVPFQTTAENLAKWFYQEARRLGIPVVEVMVKDTPKTSATYRPGV